MSSVTVYLTIYFHYPAVWPHLFHFCLHLSHNDKKSPWFLKNKFVFKARKALGEGRATWGNAFCISRPLIPTFSVFCLRTLQDGNTFIHTCDYHFFFFLAEEQLEHQFSLCSITVWQETGPSRALLKFGPHAFIMLTYCSIITILFKNIHSKMSLGTEFC